MPADSVVCVCSLSPRGWRAVALHNKGSFGTGLDNEFYVFYGSKSNVRFWRHHNNMLFLVHYYCFIFFALVLSLGLEKEVDK